MKTPRLRLLIAGGLVAFSLPPWGWWPLAFIGCAMYATVATGRGGSRPFRTGMWWALGWFVPALAWMWWINAPGYIVICLLFAALHGVAATVAWWVGQTSPQHHRPALILCHSAAETLRLSFPFGGVPVATLAISQAQSPLARLAPVGGVILMSFAVFALAMAERRLRAFLLLAAAAIVASPFSSTRAVGTATYALVQGGGPQGTHAATDTNPRRPFQVHLEATQSIQPTNALSAVIWPENVANLSRRKFAGSTLQPEIAAQAARLNVPIVVGITEDAGPTRFANAQVVVMPDGSLGDRYDKKRRVPFGEFIPFRGVLDALGAPVDMVPRDATEGTSPGFLDVANSRLAVAISWEQFFGGRVNEGVVAGGDAIVNPSNGSSYTGTIVQTQQLASSRLRAREQGRWVMQVTPTGFTAFVSPDGRVVERTGISEQKVIEHTIELRTGRTMYSRIGNGPYIWALLLGLGLVMRGARRANRKGRS